MKTTEKHFITASYLGGTVAAAVVKPYANCLMINNVNELVKANAHGLCAEPAAQAGCSRVTAAGRSGVGGSSQAMDSLLSGA